jgi:hypothetical protein
MSQYVLLATAKRCENTAASRMYLAHAYIRLILSTYNMASIFTAATSQIAKGFWLTKKQQHLLRPEVANGYVCLRGV